MSFLTAGDTEVRPAWTIPMAEQAGRGGGAIHSTLRRSLFCAEVVNWKSLVERLGGYPGVREKGLLRLEGKESMWLRMGMCW